MQQFPLIRSLRRLALTAGVAGAAYGAFAAQTSTWAIFQNTVSSNWFDVANWHNDNGSASGVLPLTGSHNVNIPVGTTCSLTNSQTGFYNFKVAGSEAASGKKGTAFFTVEAGGTIGSTVSTVGDGVGATGVVSVASNGYWNAGKPIIGNSGVGIVTNAGKWIADGEMKLGVGENSYGRLVWKPGATTTNRGNFRPIYIGYKGRGELVVDENASFTWPIYKFNGAVFLGCSQAENRLLIESNGVFLYTRLYVGGRNCEAESNPKTSGRGEIRLRGGSLAYDVQGDKEQTIWLGAFDGADGIDPTSYGAIRGWGSVTGWGDRKGDWSANFRLGYCEICADGEGDESHILDCTQGMTSISNALPPSVATESGWRAVNRGIVYPRGSAKLGTSDFDLPRTACVGSTSVLDKPDLVNSIRLTGYGLTKITSERYFGMAICAPDRTDAHTNALPRFVSVLGVIKAGVFESRVGRSYKQRSSIASAEVMIRYDQTKIARDDTRLEMWHYAEKNGCWTRVARLAQGERPADCCISSDTVVTSKASGMSTDNNGLNETFNLGTFAVIEREVSGLRLIVR